MRDEILVIFGASGFIGRFLSSVAVKYGYRLRLVSRSVENLRDLKVIGAPGQVAHYDLNFLEKNKDKFDDVFANASAVINLVGSVKKLEFKDMINVNSSFAEKIAIMAKDNDVKKFIHFSTMGVDRGDSLYFRSKSIAEESLSKVFENVIILRPNIVYGPYSWIDQSLLSFYNNLGFYPLLKKGKTRIQPIHILDLSKQVIQFIQSDLSMSGGIYSICGRREFDIASFIKFLSKIYGIRCKTLDISNYFAKRLSRFFSLLPIRIIIKPITNTFEPVFTSCAMDLLSTDMIIKSGEVSFEDLLFNAN